MAKSPGVRYKLLHQSPAMKPGEPAIPISRATAGKTKPRWRRLLRAFFLAILVLVLGVCAFIGAVTFKYNRIVHARPREITDVRPLEFGKWVDPFIGTGGIPWVCANNFPGAMRPFGMVRLGPETT